MPTQNKPDYEEIRQQLERLQKELPKVSAAGAQNTIDPTAIAKNIEQMNKKLAPIAKAIKTGDADAWTWNPEQQQQLWTVIESVLKGIKQIDQAPSEIRLAIKNQSEKLRDTLNQIAPAMQSGARATKR